jgi:predicted nucleic acid-binding Zn ribbon protein
VCGKTIINYTRRIKHFCSEECREKRKNEMRKDWLNSPRGRIKNRIYAFKINIKKKKTEKLIDMYHSLRARYEILSEYLEKRGVSKEFLEKEYRSLVE